MNFNVGMTKLHSPTVRLPSVTPGACDNSLPNSFTTYIFGSHLTRNLRPELRSFVSETKSLYLSNTLLYRMIDVAWTKCDIVRPKSI